MDNHRQADSSGSYQSNGQTNKAEERSKEVSVQGQLGFWTDSKTPQNSSGAAPSASGRPFIPQLRLLPQSQSIEDGHQRAEPLKPVADPVPASSISTIEPKPALPQPDQGHIHDGQISSFPTLSGAVENAQPAPVTSENTSPEAAAEPGGSRPPDKEPEKKGSATPLQDRPTEAGSWWRSCRPLRLLPGIRCDPPCIPRPCPCHLLTLTSSWLPLDLSPPLPFIK
jgi:hypothetical protein